MLNPGASVAEPAPPAAVEPGGWLELFFDLVFVVVVAQVAGLLTGDPSPARMLGAGGLLLICWSAWFNEVAYTNVSRGVSQRHRGYVLAAMAGVAVMAVGIPRLPQGQLWTFVAGMTIARLAFSPLWWAHWRRAGWGWVTPLLMGPGAATAWILVSLLPHPWWLAGWTVLLAGQLWVSLGRRPPAAMEGGFDTEHLLDRVGSFIMICFGEAVAQLAAALMGAQTAGAWLLGALAFALVAAMFWLFYDVTLERVGYAAQLVPGMLGHALGFAQILVVVGVVGVASGAADVVRTPTADRLLPGGALVLAGGVATFCLGVSSMSMEALRTMITLRDDQAGGSSRIFSRRAATLLGLASLAQALLVPAAVVAFRGMLPPWVALLALAASVALPSTLGYLGRRRKIAARQRALSPR